MTKNFSIKEVLILPTEFCLLGFVWVLVGQLQIDVSTVYVLLFVSFVCNFKIQGYFIEGKCTFSNQTNLVGSFSKL